MSSKNISGEDTIKLLLVEDNPADANLLMLSLKESGRQTEIHWLTDGEQAIKFVQGQITEEKNPHLIVLDLNLPRHDGFEVLAAIRASQSLRHTPVVIFTSSYRNEDVKKSQEFPSVAFLTKPEDLADYDVLGEKLLTGALDFTSAELRA